jgi:hypothetical protein
MKCCLILIALVCLGCAGKPDEETKPVAPPPRLVGRIASVHEGEGFVLVESYGEVTLTQGITLITRGGEDRAATLEVTGERQGRFVAADLKGGDVAVGDGTYIRVAESPETSSQVTTDVPIEPLEVPQSANF